MGRGKEGGRQRERKRIGRLLLRGPRLQATRTQLNSGVTMSLGTKAAVSGLPSTQSLVQQKKPGLDNELAQQSRGRLKEHF